MTLFEQWEFVNYIANKDYGGNVIEPDRFAELVKVANLVLLKRMFGLPEDYRVGMPLSREYLDATQRITDDTRFLKKREPTQAVSSGVISYPADYFTFNAIRYGQSVTIDGTPTTVPRRVEVLTEDEYSDRAGNYTKGPSEKHPVCLIRSDGIHVYPNSITAVDFNYIRYPDDPVFDYTQQTGYIEEGPSPDEYEWPKHLIVNDLTMIILSYMGINLREQQLQAYAEQHKAQGT